MLFGGVFKHICLNVLGTEQTQSRDRYIFLLRNLNARCNWGIMLTLM